MDDSMEILKQLKLHIDDSTNSIQNKVVNIVQIEHLYDLNQMQQKKYRHRNNQKQQSLVTSGEITEAESELQRLAKQNQILHYRMSELEQQKINLKFELIKYRKEINEKKKLLNKEIRDGFQILTQRPRIFSLNNKSPSKIQLFPRSPSSIKKLTQLHILFRDVIKVVRPPPLVRSNKKYTFEQFMKLNKSEYFSYIHNHLQVIRQHFLDFSYKRTQQFKPTY